MHNLQNQIIQFEIFNRMIKKINIINLIKDIERNPITLITRVIIFFFMNKDKNSWKIWMEILFFCARIIWDFLLSAEI